MNHNKIYALFEQMIRVATEELVSFTVESGKDLDHEFKADKTLVTACDRHIDRKLTQICHDAGLQVVSEEGEHVLNIVKSGNYFTIDPIDGSLGYLDYVNHSYNGENEVAFLSEDLGKESDFCLLLGLVENGKPRAGACYNFVTQEKVLMDAEAPDAFVRENNKRDHKGRYVAYLDQRPGTEIEVEILKLKDVAGIKQATLGLKSLYTILNDHESAITLHQVQTAGLWDIMPAAVAAQIFGGQVYDEQGNELDTQKYIILPGKGAVITKGSKFKFVIDKLRERSGSF